MTNYEKLISKFNIEILLDIEENITECTSCYCKEFCSSEKNKSCRETRKKWLEANVEEK